MTDIIMRRASLHDLPELPAVDGATLRLVRRDEAQQLTDLLDESYDTEAWNLQRTHAALLDADDVAKVLVVETDGRLVATASVQFKPAFPETGWVHWVATAPEYRRRGLARLVVVGVLHAIRDAGYTDARLDTQDYLEPAINLYESLGFELLPEPQEHK